jgi:hypothetical protein
MNPSDHHKVFIIKHLTDVNLGKVALALLVYYFGNLVEAQPLALFWAAQPENILLIKSPVKGF